MSDPKNTAGSPVPIPDHDLLRKIGEGAFGQVWIARTKATGRHRAVKLILRSKFHDDRPFEVEFAGVRKFEEVSREHEGFVDILQISRDDTAGYFAYVMELADDLDGSNPLNPASYAPRTLAAELKRSGRIAPSECVRVALDLTAALGELHRRSLVHRDIKPTNIVFVRGAPKLADIGLVTEIRSDEAVAQNPTFSGTPDFIDPRVHGTAGGDLFSLGKVLYQIATGLHPRDFPSLPADLNSIAEPEVFWELNRIYSKTCDTDPKARFQTADELRAELEPLLAGAWVLRWKRWIWLVKLIRRYGVLALCLAVSAIVVFYQFTQWQKKSAEAVQRKVGSFLAYGSRAMDESDIPGALSWYAGALRVDAGNQQAEPLHRLRLGATLRHCPTVVQMWFSQSESGFPTFARVEDQVMVPTSNSLWAIHDVTTGRPIHEPFGTRAPFEAAAVCPATLQAVTSAFTNSVHLWNTTNGAHVRSFVPGPPDIELWPAVISPDGRWLAVGSHSISAVAPERQKREGIESPAQVLWHTNDSALVWDLHAPGTPAPRRHEFGSRIWHLAFSPDSTRLAIAGNGGKISVIDRESGASTAAGPMQKRRIYHCAFSPDGQWLASGSYDRRARVWETISGRPVIAPLLHGDAVNSVEFSPDGRYLVTAGWDFVVRIWDTSNGRLQHHLEHNSKPIYACFSPAGRHLLTATVDGTIRIWDLRLRDREPPVVPVAASGDGMRLAFVRGQQMQIRSAANDTTISTLNWTNRTLVLWRLSHDGSRALLVFSNATDVVPPFSGQLWDVAASNPISSSMEFHSIEGNPLLSPDGRYLLARVAKGAVVWDFERAEAILTLRAWPTESAFAPSSRSLAVATGKQGEVWTWAAAHASRMCTLTNKTRIRSLTWDPKGERVAVSRAEDDIAPDSTEVRNAADGHLVAGPFTHRDGVQFAAFSPDGLKLITCGEDTFAIIQASDGGPWRAPRLLHGDQVSHAAFSADGRMVATATSREGTARIWDAQTGEPITPFFKHSRPVVRVQFVGGVRQLLTKDDRGETRLWDLTPESRDASEVARIAELVSARQSHSTETMMPQSTIAVRALWEELRSRHPAEFSFHP